MSEERGKLSGNRESADPGAEGGSAGGTTAVPRGPAQPSLASEAPAGLAPSPGLGPSEGIAPPDIFVPEGFGERLTETVEEFRSVLEDASELSAAAPPELSAAMPDAPVPEPPPAHPVPVQPPPAIPVQPPTEPTRPARPGQEPKPAVPPGKPARSRGAIVGLVVGAVAVLVVLVGLIVGIGALFRGSGDDASSSSGDAVGPADTVEEFLRALSDGDAETALSLVGDEQVNPLLTDEVLQRSNELAPLSNISVEDADPEGSEATVTATFDLGEERIRRDFSLWKFSDAWEINDALFAIPLSELEGFEPLVNGVRVDGEVASAFPGAYEIEFGLDAFELDQLRDASALPDDGVFVVASQDDAESLYSLRPALTDEAADAFRSLVRASLEQCLASRSLATPCGLDVSAPLDDGAIPVEGSAQRALTDEGDRALDELAPETAYGEGARVTTYDYIPVSTHIEADRDGERISGTLYSSGEMRQPYVDFSDEDPTLTWDRRE